MPRNRVPRHRHPPPPLRVPGLRGPLGRDRRGLAGVPRQRQRLDAQDVTALVRSKPLRVDDAVAVRSRSCYHRRAVAQRFPSETPATRASWTRAAVEARLVAAFRARPCGPVFRVGGRPAPGRRGPIEAHDWIGAVDPIEAWAGLVQDNDLARTHPVGLGAVPGHRRILRRAVPRDELAAGDGRGGAPARRRRDRRSALRSDRDRPAG